MTSVPPEQIEAIEQGRIDDPAAFDDDERLILRAADELIRNADVSEQTLGAAARRLGPQRTMELMFVVGFHRALRS